MKKYAYILLLVTGCQIDRSVPDAGVAVDATPDPQDEVVRAEVPELPPADDPVVLADIAASRMSTHEKMTGLSAYQLGQRERAARELAESSRRRTLRQGCQLARMGISEDSRPLRFEAGGGTEGAITQDHHGIANVVLNNAKLGPNWLAVMYRLSPHVGRQKELTRPRQRWTSTLPCRGAEKPDGWDEDPWTGEWEIAAPFWEKYRDAMVKAWVRHEIELAPGKPIAWGCRKDEKRPWCTDPKRALARGLCEVPGFGELNGFWAKPGNGCELEEEEPAAIPASVAAGKPRNRS